MRSREEGGLRETIMCSLLLFFRVYYIYMYSRCFWFSPRTLHWASRVLENTLSVHFQLVDELQVQRITI